MNFQIRYYTVCRGLRRQVEREELAGFIIRSTTVDRIVNDVVDRTGDAEERKIA